MGNHAALLLSPGQRSATRIPRARAMARRTRALMLWPFRTAETMPRVTLSLRAMSTWRIPRSIMSALTFLFCLVELTMFSICGHAIKLWGGKSTEKWT